MKARLNITIEEELLNKAKVYAEKKGSSVSQLVEDYFRSVTAKTKKKSLIEIIEELPKPKMTFPENFDFKKEYYEQNKKNMAFKVIPDANILLDFILKRSDDQEVLSKIYKGIVDNRFQGFTTTSIVHTCGYWLTKAFDEMYAKKTLIGLLGDVRIIEAPHRITEDALYSDMNDIEDAIQYYTSLHHKLDVFISRDKKFIKSSKSILPVMHPKEFVKEYIDN